MSDMNELKLADLGEGMHEAEIVEWLIKEGDNVKLDQPVVRVETDKAIVEIPSPVAGRVREICFRPGDTAEVGEVLIIYDTPQEQGNGKVRTEQAKPGPASAPQPTQPAQPVKSASGGGQRVLAAPAVRKLAYELDIDLANVPASSPNGRITLDDVHNYVQRARLAPKQEEPATTEVVSTPVSDTPARSSQPREDERAPLTGLRKRVAEHMERSWRTIPHATS